MIPNNTTTSSLSKTMLGGISIFLCVFLFAGTVYGGHGSGSSSGAPSSGKAICEKTLPPRSTRAPQGTVDYPKGLYVPVKDFEAEALLGRIVQLLNAMEHDTDLMEKDTQYIRYYLLQLCMKEYEYDHTLQHAWAEVIGKFVKETENWVIKVYNKNPIFLTNQTVYYTLVEKYVLKTYLKEIEASKIGSKTKREIKKMLERQSYETLFPNDKSEEEWAPDDLARNLTENLSWADWNKLMVAPQYNISAVAELAQLEYEGRRNRALGYESEKLGWGRGFFSYELCDLKIYTVSSFDRRNCRIVTPGSLIQDQVSLMFGTAIRQMENADEFEEWIAGNTITVLSDILSYAGLNNVKPAAREDGFDNTDPSGGYHTRIDQATTPVSPKDAEGLITEFEERPPKDGGDKTVFYPIEFGEIKELEQKAVEQLPTDPGSPSQ